MVNRVQALETNTAAQEGGKEGETEEQSNDPDNDEVRGGGGRLR